MAHFLHIICSRDMDHRRNNVSRPGASFSMDSRLCGNDALCDVSLRVIPAQAGIHVFVTSVLCTQQIIQYFSDDP